MNSIVQKLSISAVSSALLTLGTVASAEAASFYSITNLDGFGISRINNLGQIVGSFEGRAALWQDGSIQTLGTLGGNLSTATAINDLGQVVGESETASGERRAFLWENGLMQDLGTLPKLSYDSESYSQATNINNLGQVVGQSNNEAFVWDRDTGMKSLCRGRFQEGTCFDRTSIAYSINNQGQIVGSAGSTPSSVGATLWENGTQIRLGNYETFYIAYDNNDAGQIVGRAGYGASEAALLDNGTLIPISGGYRSLANAINARGQIVGWSSAFSTEEAYLERAALWEDNSIRNLNNFISADSGWILEEAIDINDAGQIIGYGKFNGQTQSFLLTPESNPEPVPEPTTVLGLLAFGAFSVGSQLKRQQKSTDTN